MFKIIEKVKLLFGNPSRSSFCFSLSAPCLLERTDDFFFIILDLKSSLTMFSYQDLSFFFQQIGLFHTDLILPLFYLIFFFVFLSLIYCSVFCHRHVVAYFIANMLQFVLSSTCSE